MIRWRPVGLRGLDPRAQVPNIAHGLRCDAKPCCDARRQGVAHLSIRLGFKDLDRLRICVHIQAEYMSNVPECMASNQFNCRHRALRSVAHAVIHHTCSPLSVVAGLGSAWECTRTGLPCCGADIACCSCDFQRWYVIVGGLLPPTSRTISESRHLQSRTISCWPI